jgi:hypothetical protein
MSPVPQSLLTEHIRSQLPFLQREARPHSLSNRQSSGLLGRGWHEPEMQQLVVAQSALLPHVGEDPALPPVLDPPTPPTGEPPLPGPGPRPALPAPPPLPPPPGRPPVPNQSLPPEPELGTHVERESHRNPGAQVCEP